MNYLLFTVFDILRLRLQRYKEIAFDKIVKDEVKMNFIIKIGAGVKFKIGNILL